MAQIDVVSHLTELMQPVINSLGLELIEIEYKREGRQMVLRIFIDKPEGITVEDCSALSREISQLLDVEDIVPGHYNLEVSSPGLNRPLKTSTDYMKYIGRLIKLRTFELLPDDSGNRRKTFMGELLGLDNDMVRIKLIEGQTATIPLAKVAKANLEFVF